MLVMTTIAWAACQPTHSPVPASPVSVQSQPPAPTVEPQPYLSLQQLAESLKRAPTLARLTKLHPPFDSLQFDKAMAYDYNGAKGEQALYIVEEGRLAPTIVAQQPLDGHDVEALVGLLYNKRAYGDAPAFCFEPHLGIVFYQSDSIVAHLSICISCKRLTGSPAVPAHLFPQVRLPDGTSYPADGLNDRTLQQLRKWLRQWQFRSF